MHTKLAVVGDVNGNGSIVLAATPPLKAVSVKKVGAAEIRVKTIVFVTVIIIGL